MRFAYADPPYLGCGRLYDAHHVDSRRWDTASAHEDLILSLCAGYPDGWALSCSTPSLRVLLPFCPDDTRIGSWVKPFAIFKPNVGVAYAWEPILFRGGRRRTRSQPTLRDWVSANITLKKGLTGAKPPIFCEYILDLMNYQTGDEIVDLFPGTGSLSMAVKARAPVSDLFG